MVKEDDGSDSEDITLRTLTTKLNVNVPFSDTYVFKGTKGTFIIDTDRRTPTERVLEEDD